MVVPLFGFKVLWHRDAEEVGPLSYPLFLIKIQQQKYNLKNKIINLHMTWYRYVYLRLEGVDYLYLRVKLWNSLRLADVFA